MILAHNRPDRASGAIEQIVAIGMDYIDQWFIKLWKDISHADFIQTSFLFLLMMYDFVAGFLFGMGSSNRSPST